MDIRALGFTLELERYAAESIPDGFKIARVIAEHRERYHIHDGTEELEAEIMGNLRFSATSRADFPAVGDWVAYTPFDEGKGLIHSIFPRKTVIERQAVGKQGEKQIIGANIDHGIIVQALDRDYNLNRLERYLTICHEAKIAPMVVLTKSDLVDRDKLSELMVAIDERVRQIPVFAISNLSMEGIETLAGHIQPGSTYCMLGSSGVGKSTLINSLSGKQLMATKALSESTGKGSHTTTHRQLLLLDSGALLIDNPGMRELGTADSSQGLEETFGVIEEIAEGCRYSDCTHTTKDGCAVLAAVEEGTIDAAVLENYLRLKREQEHYESTVAERRQKDKAFGKMVKEVMKQKKDKRGNPIILLLMALSLSYSCRSLKVADREPAVMEYQTPRLLFVISTIAQDTLNATYLIEDVQIQTETGGLKDYRPKRYEEGDLICRQLDSNGSILFETAFQNPLQQTMEYVDDNGQLGLAELKLEKSDLVLRLPLEPTATSVVILLDEEVLLVAPVSETNL